MLPSSLPPRNVLRNHQASTALPSRTNSSKQQLSSKQVAARPVRSVQILSSKGWQITMGRWIWSVSPFLSYPFPKSLLAPARANRRVAPSNRTANTPPFTLNMQPCTIHRKEYTIILMATVGMVRIPISALKEAWVISFDSRYAFPSPSPSLLAEPLELTKGALLE